MDPQEQIISQLKQKLSAEEIFFEDQSRLHRSHSEAIRSGGGHFAVTVVAECFQGKTLLERHRMVYAALKDLQHHIHALSIQALTRQEYSQSP